MQNFSLRSQGADGSSALPFNIDEFSVSDWLTNLPVADKMETCKTVFASLRNLNRHNIAAGKRFKILEKFRTVVFVESSNLAARIKDAPFPLEARTRKIAKLAVKFHSELAYGYQLIVKDEAFEDSFSTCEQACVLHRIIRSIGMSLLRVAQMYEPPSSKNWDLLKKLYKQAEINHLLDIKVQDATIPIPDSSTIAGILGSAVLFSVSNPYRHSQSEMDRVFRLFDSHSGRIEWRNDPHGLLCALFGIDLENLSAPQHVSSYAKFQNKSFRAVDPSKLLAAIAEPETTQGHAATLPNAITVTRLLHHLGRPRPVRIKSIGTDTELTLGLEKITAVLKLDQSKPSTKMVAPLADWLIAPNFELQPLTDRHPGNKFADRTDSTNPSHRLRPLQDAQTAGRTGDAPGASSPLPIGSSTFRCEVHQSELAAHVLVELKTDSLAVGQIVSFRDESSRIQIGVIRWMQANTTASCFYYGVERLRAECSLANVIISSSKYNDILLFEKVSNGLASHSLIMPAARHRPGTRLTVRQPRSTSNFVIEKLLEISLFFSHYALKRLHDAEQRTDAAEAAD